MEEVSVCLLASTVDLLLSFRVISLKKTTIGTFPDQILLAWSGKTLLRA